MCVAGAHSSRTAPFWQSDRVTQRFPSDRVIHPLLTQQTEMFASRQLLRAAGQVAKQSSDAIPAPTYFRPASEAPSPNTHLVVAIGVGTVCAVTYKVRVPPVTVSLTHSAQLTSAELRVI